MFAQCKCLRKDGLKMKGICMAVGRVVIAVINVYNRYRFVCSILLNQSVFTSAV